MPHWNMQRRIMKYKRKELFLDILNNINSDGISVRNLLLLQNHRQSLSSFFYEICIFFLKQDNRKMARSGDTIIFGEVGY